MLARGYRASMCGDLPSQRIYDENRNELSAYL